MKEFKGTPGPWHYCAEEPDWVTDSNDNIAVARVTRYNTDAEAQRANARLIAAAPELLEALQRITPLYEALMRDCGIEHKEMIAISRAAINKALGE